MTSVPLELLEALAREEQPEAGNSQPSGTAGFDLEKWIAHYALDVDGPKPWNGGNRWLFRVCPWDPEHRNRSAYILRLPNGAIAAGCHHNGCADKNWHTLRDLVEGSGRQRRNGTVPHGNELDSSAVWEPVVPFGQFDLPSFPTETLPYWLRAFVEAEATATQTPIDLAALLSLSVIAAAVAKKIVVCIRKGYREPLNIFTVTALPPGNRKTAVFADTTRPLEQYEQSESQRLSREIAKTQSLYKIREAALKRAQDEAARAKPQEQQRLAEVAAQMAAELTALKIPCPPRYVADDCTPERLATILRDQGGRIAVMSPEGDVFDLMAGRYSANGTSNFGVYLKGHAGDTLRVDRVGRPPDFVKAPALTVGLAVQPEVLRGLVEKPGFRGRGLLGRFQYSLPKSLLGNRITNAPPVPDDVRATYHKNVLALLEVPLGTDEDGSNVLNLEPVAQECLQHFDAWLEPQLAEFGELGGVTDWAGKLVGTIGRLAGILHVAAFAGESTPWEIPVSPQTVEHAIAIGRYLIPHAKAAYAEMGADAVVEQAKRILRWIEHGGLSRFTKRDVHQGMRGRFKRTEELDAPLTLLIDHGYVRKRPQPKHDGPGRPPSPVFEVNPLWTTQNTQNLQNTPSDQNFEDCEDCEKAAVDLGLARVQTSGVEEGLAEDAGELE